MCDQDSRSLSLSLLYRKQPLKEYTLYEAVDEIIVIQNLPDNKKIRDRLERMLKDAIHTGDLKAKNGVRYHEYLEYPQFLSLNPKQLSHYIISGDELYKWVCGEEEPKQEDNRTKGEINAERQLFELMRAIIFIFLKNNSSIDGREVNKIIKKNGLSFSDLLRVIKIFKKKYPKQLLTDIPARSTVSKVITMFKNHREISEKK